MRIGKYRRMPDPTSHYQLRSFFSGRCSWSLLLPDDDDENGDDGDDSDDNDDDDGGGGQLVVNQIRPVQRVPIKCLWPNQRSFGGNFHLHQPLQHY